MEEETISHLFYYCTHMQDIWNQIQAYFTDFLHFSQLQTTYMQYQKIWGFIFKQFS